MPRSNIQRLKDEGFDIDPKLPEEYADVIEELRPGEIDVLVDVVRRLDRADKCNPGEPGYTTYFHSF